jgi:hypothetical protein
LEVKILKLFDADPGSGMETVRIRDPGWKKVGSGINIPDPQHWYTVIPIGRTDIMCGISVHITA